MTLTSEFDPDRLLAALPHRPIGALSEGTVLPPIRAVGVLSDYNGFSGKERLRTFEVAKWLTRIGAIPHSGRCDLCGKFSDQQHAENYYDLATWIDICRGCHSSLHQRFRSAGWQRRLEELNLSPTHWAWCVSQQPFDFAAILRSRGAREPTFTDFFHSSACYPPGLD